MTAPRIENGRETAVEILTALGRSEWRMRTGKAPGGKRQRESVSEMKNVRNGANH